MDYYDKYSSMNEEKLLDEIEELNKRLFKIRGNSPIRSQLLDMIHTAENFYREFQSTRRVKLENTVINIGEIESSVNTPEYSSIEVLNILVTGYTKGLNK